MIHFLLANLLMTSAFAAPTLPRYRLSELYKTTVSGSEQVLSKEEDRKQVLELKNQSLGALLPQVTGIGTYSKTDIPFAFSGGTQKNLRITGRQFIFKGGAEYAFISRTNRLLEARDAELLGSNQSYFLDLANAYYATLLRQAELSHAQTELKLYDEQISELKSRVKIGRSRTSDLLSAQAARASSEAQFHTAESNLVNSKINLSNIARISPEFELAEETPANVPLESLENYLSLSAGRPDLVAARKRNEVAAKDVAIQRDGHFPTLDLAGNYYLHREGFFNNASQWDAILTLTVPIFSGGVTQSTVRQFASVMKSTEIETGRLERAAENEIRSLYQNLIASQAELKSLNEAVDLAQRSYEQTKKDYRFGLTTNLDLLSSLKTLTNAKKALDQARFAHFLERIQIEIGSGRIPKLGS